jgi:hypothetical protein
LGKFRWLFILDADQRNPLVILHDAHRTDGDLIASLGLTDRAPIAGGKNESDYEYRRERDREDEKALFQCKFPKHQFAALLWGIRRILSIRFLAPRRLG